MKLDLGFKEGLPGREPKILNDALKNRPFQTLNEGKPPPCLRKDSEEAKGLAIEFCETKQTAKRLWPDNPNGPCNWPVWSKDRSK